MDEQDNLERLRAISEQREIDEKLRQDISAAVVEAMPDALVVVDQNGSIFQVNREAELMFGYKRTAMIGQKVEMLIPEDRRSRHIEHRIKYAEEPRTRSMGAGLDLSARHSSGKEFPVEITLSPLPTDERGLFTVTVIRRRRG